MGIAKLERDRVVANAVEALGMDATAADLETPEVLAASVRRAASFLCPVTPRVLTRNIEESLDGLVEEARLVDRGSMVSAMIEDLVAYGDLVEAPIDDEQSGLSRRLLFLAQPSYVTLSPDVYILVGVRSDGLSLCDGLLDDRIEHYHHARRVTLQPGEEPTELLGGLGLRELSFEQWLNSPKVVAAQDLVQEYETRLAAAGPSGSVEPVRILDPTTPVTYYRGRWRSVAARDNGKFIGRRPVQFGADQWCYFDVVDGEVIRLIDLPVLDRLAQGCDEAWRLQAALDTLSGAPQLLRVQKARTTGDVVLRFLSPIPSWSQRRLDAVGQALGHLPGSLFAYKVSESQLEHDLAFLEKTMWLQVEREGGVE